MTELQKLVQGVCDAVPCNARLRNQAWKLVAGDASRKTPIDRLCHVRTSILLLTPEPSPCFFAFLPLACDTAPASSSLSTSDPGSYHRTTVLTFRPTNRATLQYLVFHLRRTGHWRKSSLDKTGRPAFPCMFYIPPIIGGFAHTPRPTF